MSGIAIPDAATWPPAIQTQLIALARAAWNLVDDAEERDGNDFFVDSKGLTTLSAALDALDKLPNPPNEEATGPRKAEYWFEHWAKLSGTFAHSQSSTSN